LAAFAKNLKVSRSSCKLLKFNVEDLLALPQLQQGKFTRHVSHVNLGAALAEVKDIMEFQAKEKQLRSVEFKGFPKYLNG